jgi:hypothetical protein
MKSLFICFTLGIVCMTQAMRDDISNDLMSKFMPLNPYVGLKKELAIFKKHNYIPEDSVVPLHTLRQYDDKQQEKLNNSFNLGFKKFLKGCGIIGLSTTLVATGVYIERQSESPNHLAACAIITGLGTSIWGTIKGVKGIMYKQRLINKIRNVERYKNKRFPSEQDDGIE